MALAIGARSSPASAKPLGGRAEAIATTLSKPVLIVPPDAAPPESFRRVLVPLEGSLSSSLAPRWLFELHGESRVDVVALHIHDEPSIPAFTDQPQHEVSAWTRESSSATARGASERCSSRPGSEGSASSSTRRRAVRVRPHRARVVSAALSWPRPGRPRDDPALAAASTPRSGRALSVRRGAGPARGADDGLTRARPCSGTLGHGWGPIAAAATRNPPTKATNQAAGRRSATRDDSAIRA